MWVIGGGYSSVGADIWLYAGIETHRDKERESVCVYDRERDMT